MSVTRTWIALPCFVALAACCGATEASQVRLNIESEPSRVTQVTNAEGYIVTLHEAWLVLRDFEFTTAAEQHTASLMRRAYDWLVPAAVAHPGHYQGGTVVGALRGRFVVDALQKEPSARLICSFPTTKPPTSPSIWQR